MNRVKYLILGAGPAGLTLANRLKQEGESSFLVLEEKSEAGGLCRSAEVDGKMLDTGGGHFLDIRRPEVNKFLFEFLPEEEWNRFERISKIDLGEHVIDYPFESSIWQLPEDEQIEHLKAIAKAGCNIGVLKPESFVEWIPWKLGEKIAKDYMLPYNRKMWSMNLNELGTYWLEKLPDVSFEDTLRSCLTHKAYAKQPGHAEFFYPKKYGYGELWLRIAESLGDRLKTGVSAAKLDIDENTVNDEFKADIIINTVPWTVFETIKGADDRMLKGIKTLKHSSIVTEYFSENMDTKAHWIYYPEEAKDYHRILVRHNFCPGSRGYWTETNLARYKESSREHFVNEYAYPLNTIGKNETMAELLLKMKEHNVIGLGRWGEWQHFNSDVVVERALKLAEELGA